MFTDYTKRENRLKKEKKVWVVDQDGNKFQTDSNRLHRFTGDKDFRLADNDDFFGFSENESSKVRMIWKVALTIIIAYFAWYVFQAVSFITQPAPVATSTQSVVDYSNLKPLPKVNWNFTPINQR